MKHRVLAVARPIAGAIAAGLLSVALAGCFSDFAPMSPGSDDSQVGQTSLSNAPRNAVYFGFTDGTKRAGKLLDIPPTGKSVSKSFNSGGGSFTVSETDIINAPSAQDDISVTFTVPKDALTQTVTIKMTVYGNALSQMLVAFEPSGLAFLKTATLTLKIGNYLVDIPVSLITAYHVDAETGIVTAATVTSTTQEKDRLAVQVAVPGFSRYGLAD